MFGFFEKLVNPYPAGESVVPPSKFLAFVWQCTAGMRGLLLGVIICSALLGAFEAALFAIMGRIVDWLATIQPANLWQQEGDKLLLLIAAIVVSVVVTCLWAFMKYQALAGNFPMRLRWVFHRLILNQSMVFFQDEFAGRVSAKVMQTALAVRDTCFILTDILSYVLVYFLAVALIIAGFDKLLLPPFLIWLGLFGAALYWFVPRLSKVSRAQADARSLMTGRITDAYTNITTVKLFSHAGREAEFARFSMRDFMTHVNAQMRLVSLFELVIDVLNKFLVLSAAGIALWLWSRGQVGVGALAATTALALRLWGMSHWVMWEMTALFENVGTVQDGINTLTRSPAIIDRVDAQPLVVTRGEVTFDNVSFSYGKREGVPVINDLNLKIRPGEKIGLVGRSGAGKSTLINLLLRFYDVEEGRVLIDGQDIATVTQDSLRSQIGMVTQDTSLLHRSVRDNILYGRPDAAEHEVVAAARQAEAEAFIADLRDPAGRAGYDAHVGERGVKLSGGQRQRVAIARVMLKDAPILLLDEATSALDSEVEAAIQESLYRLMEGKTVIAIAHRLSTIAAMDRLIVLEEGRIIEEGSHSQLLGKHGLYAKLWARQSGGFIGEEVD